jgi:hypothetical protein
MKTKLLGTLDFKNKKTFHPNRKCVNCPFLFDFWCSYLKCRIPDLEYYSDCPVVEIIVEEL